MQETSALYRRIMSATEHWFETRVVIGESGDLITERGERIMFGVDTIVVSRMNPESGFAEDQVFSVKTSTQMFEHGPEIGKAIASEIDVKMLKPAGEMPRMSVVVPYVRVCAKQTSTRIEDDYLIVTDAYLDENDFLVLPNASLENGYVCFNDATEIVMSEWLQQGVYFIDTREISNNDDSLVTLTLHGFDAMLKAEQDFSETGTMPDTDIVSMVAEAIGVSVDPRTWDVMTEGYTFTVTPSYTMREMLGYIAGAYGGVFLMTDLGELRLVTLWELPKETRYLVDDAGYVIVFGEDRILV